MTQPNPSTAMARSIIDELTRHGVGAVIISPGGRSAALSIAAQEHPDAEVRVVIDERSAGFHALGWAKATGSPAVVVSTSGTAPANYMPAVVEADMSLTPLIVLSADRPAELHGVGANQTIDQKDLYGKHARAFTHIAAPDSGIDLNGSWRDATSRAVAVSMGEGGTPGPVHLNIAFREPTMPVTDDGRIAGEEYAYAIEGRNGGKTWHEPEIEAPVVGRLDIESPSKGLVIAGEGLYDRNSLGDAAADLGWPIIATAMSGMRGGDVIANYHHLLASGVPNRLRPEIVFAVGSIGPSPRLEDLCDSAGTTIRIDHWGRHIDPRRHATRVIHADPSATLAGLSAEDPDPGWVETWANASAAIGESVGSKLDSASEMSGGRVARAMNRVSWETLIVASSLPIREIDAHLDRSGPVIANRGASGIDGFASTALGAASTSQRALALAGDLSVLHDSNGFLIDTPIDLVLIVLDNDGGGLFDELPPAHHAPDFERLFVAPHGRDLSTLAEFHSIAYAEVASPDELVDVANRSLDGGGITMIRVPIDRHADLAIRESLDRAGKDQASKLER